MSTFDLTEQNLKELVKEDDKGQPVDNHQPEDSAAAFFMLNERKLELLVSTLSLKALRRVVLNVALGGLGKREHKLIGGPQGNEQKTAYSLNEAVTQRFMMQLALEMKKVEEADKAEKEITSSESEASYSWSGTRNEAQPKQIEKQTMETEVSSEGE